MASAAPPPPSPGPVMLNETDFLWAVEAAMRITASRQYRSAPQDLSSCLMYLCMGLEAFHTDPATPVLGTNQGIQVQMQPTGRQLLVLHYLFQCIGHGIFVNPRCYLGVV